MAEQKDSRGKLRKQFQTFNTEPTMTVQSDAQQADIQHILGKYKAGLTVEGLNDAQGMFMDVSNFDDFADIMRQSVAVDQEFMKLPSKVREIFDHDSAKWLDAAMDQEKRDALVAEGDIEGTKVAVAVGQGEGVGSSGAAGETPPTETGGSNT